MSDPSPLSLSQAGGRAIRNGGRGRGAIPDGGLQLRRLLGGGGGGGWRGGGGGGGGGGGKKGGGGGGEGDGRPEEPSALAVALIVKVRVVVVVVRVRVRVRVMVGDGDDRRGVNHAVIIVMPSWVGFGQAVVRARCIMVSAKRTCSRGLLFTPDLRSLDSVV
jgi:hypothetical protein